MQPLYNDPSWLVTLGRWRDKPLEMTEKHLAPQGWSAGIHGA